MQKLDGIDSKISGLGERVAANENRVMALEGKVNDIATRLYEFEERQRQILVATSSGDILDIRSQMQKPPFRSAFDNAVHEVLSDKPGIFTVTNKMPTYQRISVNRVEYGLSPNQRVTLEVPLGTVTTELPGQEIKNWTVAAPGYSESIDIVPSKQWTAFFRGAEPAAPTAPAAPVYTSYYAPEWTTSHYQPPVYTAPVTSTYVNPAPVVVGYAPTTSWWW
jgi:hypothetical protein